MPKQTKIAEAFEKLRARMHDCNLMDLSRRSGLHRNTLMGVRNHPDRFNPTIKVMDKIERAIDEQERARKQGLL